MPSERIITYARLAESLGIDYLCTNNRLKPFDRDPFVRLTLLALNTERTKIGAWSVSPFMYHPVSASRAISQIDELAPGRVFLSYTAGSPAGLSTVGLGSAARRPLRPMREAVELSKLILSGHVPPEVETDQEVREGGNLDEYNINYSGEFFQLEGNVVLPSRKVPVGVHTFSPKMLQLGGELADEVLTGWFANPDGNEWALNQIADGARRGGRSLDDIKIHRCIHIALWPDRDVAIQTILPISQVVLILSAKWRKEFGIKLPFEKQAGDVAIPESEAFRYAFPKLAAAYSGSLELAHEIPLETHLLQVVAGNPDDCIEQLRRSVVHPRFDALHFALFVPPPEYENWPKALELLMKEVVPALTD